MPMPNKIWFDKKTLRQYKKLTIISAAMVITGVILSILGYYVNLFGSSGVWGIMVSLFLIQAGGILFLIFLHGYLQAAFYLGRLKNNGYEVPSDAKDYGGRLENLPHTREPVDVNRYASDSKIAAWISLVLYILLGTGDVLFYCMWQPYAPDSIVLFVLILIALSVFPVLAFIFFRQSNKDKYIDLVDINDGRHRVRRSLFSSIILLIIFGLVGAFGLICANSMTRYIYRSRNSSYDRRIEDFYADTSMEVDSDDLNGEEWSSDLETRTPSLSFDKVDGAAYYVIYMVDESDGCPVAWYVEHTNDTEFEAGSAAGVYNGITAHPDSPHRYSITVYALVGDPDSTLTIDPDRRSSFDPMGLYYEILNVTDRSHNPPIYGNVLAYGYIYGFY